LIVADADPPSAALRPGRHHVSVGTIEHVALESLVAPRRRGPLQFAPIEVRSSGPLGLAFRERSYPQTALTAAVWPDVLQLRDEQLLPPGRRLGGLRSRRAESVGREFESLRDYVRGDEYRRISWKATARRGRPVVAVQQPERRQTVVLALETGRLMFGSGGAGLGKLDRAVNAAVMLAAVALEYGDAVGATAFGRAPAGSLAPQARPGQLRRVLDLAARVDPELVEPDWGRGLAEVGRLSRRRALVVVFSDALYLETDPRLSGRLGRLARRHLVLFAALRDAELDEMAQQPVVDGRSLYERGAAAHLLERRAQSIRTLERTGVHVLDTGPERLTGAIVGRFHQLRSAGVL
jgi:uncharacterized protein (DUF58 family)